VLLLSTKGTMERIEELIVELRAANVDVRKQAAIEIGDLLVSRFDKSPKVREAALLALIYKRATNVQKALIGALEDEQPKVREMAADSLQKLFAFYQKVKYVHFGVISRGEEKYGTTIKDPDLSELTIPMPNLWWVYINTRSSDPALLENFINYALKYLDREDLKKHVNICYFSGPHNLNPDLQQRLKNLFASEWQLQ
jgi:HEAT repeat protein